ncbi:PREDICTED: probable polyamine transporter At1g31830 [Tarenaya hassleriana]|uniref:probable polyamine transporter At1g31830 n=1 Tax=Tarenaya hassleriana TaxID=28532 RepID=UPI00053C9C78|nr:PREDICTED: probable polyamine transporter At1g31830 [Tarenaya hassleriana]
MGRRYDCVEYITVAGDDTSPAGTAGGDASSPRANKFRKISVLPLVFLIFYEVSGGPFGVEDSVNAAGPLMAILGFVTFPFVWSVPEALITAEMGTMFPENGGYVVWVSSALGPYWGFQQGWVKWLSGVIDNALYPVLFLDYLQSGIPALAGGWPRILSVFALTLVLTYLNYRGLTIVGFAAVLLGILSLLPFLVIGLISIPKLNPSRWLVVDLRSVDWNLYLNTLFWNLNYWDSISTLAGEVENPKKTLPKALFYALILVVVSYIIPLLSGTGATPLNRELWTDGYLADIAKILGGAWLGWWVQVAAATSNMGMFLAEMSSDSFQLLGMAERGMIPEFFAKRSRHGTPLIGILFSASGVILLSWLSFQEIVAAENLLYCVGMILEFIAFVRLRMKYPAASRPYKIPVGTVGSVLMCIPPTILIFVVMAFSTLKVAGLSLGIVVIGLVMQPCLKHVEKKRWLKFSVSSDLPDLHHETAESPTE